MTRTIRWIPIFALLLCAGLLGVLEYLPWREKVPLRFHMDSPSSDEIGQKRTPVELCVENTSKYPVVYYGGSIFLADKPVAYFCQLKGSLGNGVVIQPGGTYTHQKDVTGQALGMVRDAKTEMRYSWAPVREAWFARTFLPAIKDRLPSRWSSAIPVIQRRREVAPVKVVPVANGQAS